jgi:hypothetical protein
MPDRVDFAAEVRSLRETLLPEPRMTRTLPCLFAALALAACGAEESPSPSYAFIGTWDCGTTTLAFTNSTFDRRPKQLSDPGRLAGWAELHGALRQKPA